MVDRKVVPFDEFYYQLKLMYLFQKHPVYIEIYRQVISIKYSEFVHIKPVFIPPNILRVAAATVLVSSRPMGNTK
jgi:hypothetical protein